MDSRMQMSFKTIIFESAKIAYIILIKTQDTDEKIRMGWVGWVRSNMDW